jgi:hypothetical protein
VSYNKLTPSEAQHQVVGRKPLLAEYQGLLCDVVMIRRQITLDPEGNELYSVYVKYGTTRKRLKMKSTDKLIYRQVIREKGV